ncbi:NUDIX domain-containing protein [Actinomadura harenae]|uniref:NUDIX domain-containing protein n=1 Tax=Actinomadura harenae TaxID=2483351 RepID=A0A3M2M8K7_9ACTN|nr:NUDIX domain-containing protein [Actinomadura harenae]RMI45320.1 NUDIX domain-containing protein [Actinomadura harenae]
MGDVTAGVESAIRTWIASGELGPGDRLPSERVLAERLGAGRTTIRQVLGKLVSEDVLSVRRGSGYYVASSRRFDSQNNPLEPWRLHGERTVYDNRWVRLSLADVEPPGVDRFEHHVVHLHRVSIAVVLDERDRVLMLWRYRFVPNKFGWELPGGIVDEGEAPRQTALREVEEETGWRPRTLEHLVTFEPMVGMVDSPHEVFVGRGADKVGEPSDVEEAGEVAWIPLSEVHRLIRKDELLGSGTLVGLLHVIAYGA